MVVVVWIKTTTTVWRGKCSLMLTPHFPGLARASLTRAWTTPSCPQVTTGSNTRCYRCLTHLFGVLWVFVRQNTSLGTLCTLIRIATGAQNKTQFCQFRERAVPALVGTRSCRRHVSMCLLFESIWNNVVSFSIQYDSWAHLENYMEEAQV